MSLSSYDCS